jgi:hypothetical protein
MLLPLLLLAAVVGYYFWAGYAADRELAEVVAEIDRTDPDWRLEQIQEKRKSYSPEENAADTVLAARQLLPPGWPPTVTTEDGVIASLGDRVSGLPPEVQADEALARDLRAGLAADGVKDALAMTERLSRQTGGRFNITYGPNPLDAPSPYQDVRAAIALLRNLAVLQDQDGQADASLATARRIVIAGRGIGDEPSMIAQLVRVAAHSIAVQSVERALAQGLPSGEALAQTQRLLAEDAAEPLFVYALRGERASQHRLIELIKSGEGTLIGTPPSNWRERVDQVHLSQAARRGHAEMLRTLNRALEVARRDPEGQAEELQRLDAELDHRAESRRGKDVLINLLMPAVSKMCLTFQRDRAIVRGAVVGLALERYRLDTEHWPEKLGQLVPAYLSAVPTDPFDGKELRYRKLADGVIVYSVGPDRQDNGGALNRANPLMPGTDLGFRLWDATARRQPAAELLPPPEDSAP